MAPICFTSYNQGRGGFPPYEYEPENPSVTSANTNGEESIQGTAEVVMIALWIA